MSVSFANQLTPTNQPFNDRILEDSLVKATIAMPASAGTANTGNIDLQQATPYPTTETINVLVSTAASANGNVNASNGVIYLQDAAANSDGTANATLWANIATLGTVPLVEAATVVATSNTFKLPPGCRRFIRAQMRTQTGAGNYADANLTIKLLF